MKARDTGILGEKLAGKYLEEQGYAIIGTNYRSRGGEIDIVASRDGMLCFVEVRTKSSRNFGTPGESVTPRKKKRLVLTAQDYVQKHGVCESDWRIDFIGVELDGRGKAVRIEHLESAIGEE
jgi:putative endonuclease